MIIESKPLKIKLKLRDLLNQLNKDFENDQLRREKLYAEDELRAFKEKTLVLEKQIEE